MCALLHICQLGVVTEIRQFLQSAVVTLPVRGGGGGGGRCSYEQYCQGNRVPWQHVTRYSHNLKLWHTFQCIFMEVIQLCIVGKVPLEREGRGWEGRGEGRERGEGRG